MTELEFEKACRGPNTAVANEHAWGNTTITAAATISGTDNGTETLTTANANAACSNTSFTGGDTGYGPLRCGIFATSTSTRTTAGAGYYGNMELSGGLWEKTVSIGNPTGRTYTGAHGDGILTTTASYQGNATNTGWPGIDGTTARGVTGATGAGERGGDFSNAPTYSRVSQRYQAAYTDTSRGAASGIRCARTPS
jgi:hypothetical protein